MTAAISPQEQKEKTLSPEILAALIIVSADFYLQQSTKQYIDLKDQTVQWEQLFRLPLTDGHRAAIGWAYSIWNQAPHPTCNPFETASSMDSELKKAVLRALALRWG